MKRLVRGFAVFGCLVSSALGADTAVAQKSGGILKVYHRDSPASMSILEEGTNSTEIPMMGVFNNLVMYDQQVAQNSLSTIVPDLATDWSAGEDGKQLTFHLRQGVKWHDGKPFTANDVKCTWELLTGKSSEKLRLNPRKSWYNNIEEITTNGDHEATFVLKRPQPWLIALLASGYAPVYPCHVPPRDMRTHPIGTGPFKFVEFKPNERIVVARNPDYWKKGRPYLDGIEYTIIPNRSTAILAFIAGNFDMTFPFEVSIPLLKDIKTQAPQAICDLAPGNASTNLILNRDKPPFDNPEIRRAMMLSLDRKSFIDILAEGQGDIGGAMQPPPAGIWGMPPELLKTVPGYDPDVRQNRARSPPDHGEARLRAGQSFEADGLGTQHCDLPRSRGHPDRPAQRRLYRRRARSGRDCELVSQSRAQGLPDRPEQYRKRRRRPRPAILRELRLRLGTQLHRLLQPGARKAVRRQSMEADPEKRRKLVWEIDKKLQEDGARPIIYHFRAATCWQPKVKGLTIMVNSQYNGWRFEDLWLDE